MLGPLEDVQTFLWHQDKKKIKKLKILNVSIAVLHTDPSVVQYSKDSGKKTLTFGLYFKLSSL